MNSGILNTALLMACAVLLDRLLGEPRRFHPLVGFGHYAAWLERRLNRNYPLEPKPPLTPPCTRKEYADGSPLLCNDPISVRGENRSAPPLIRGGWEGFKPNGQSRLNKAGAGKLRGVIAWLLAIVPFLAVTIFLWQQPVLRPWLSVLILYLALGLQSLREHANRIQTALEAVDLNTARQRVGEIVSRDTTTMQTEDVARASVESVLENGNDAVFGALFWFALLGAPGALLYRLANTLDAMWGYRTTRYLHFGRAAARLDDALNFFPARLTAISYALLGNTRLAWRCWRRQAPVWDSPNAGPVMASGAGSLGLLLGGAANYHGAQEQRPPLGAGHAPQTADIGRALKLVQRGVWLWLAVLLILGASLA
ncbi:MAG: adenosylcobinamide-phosphate synthase CbiB [Gallionellaceae bacterium]